jgi:general secretion pathway protein M
VNSLRPATPSLLAPARAWWQGLAARERMLLAVGATVVGLGIVWALLLQPAWRTLQGAPVERDRLDAQWQAMQRLATEAQQLRATPPVSAQQAAAALSSATERLGTLASLSLQGERAVVTFNGIGTTALRDWLAEVRAGARARPVEATLTRGAQGYSGTMVLSLGGGA